MHRSYSPYDDLKPLVVRGLVAVCLSFFLFIALIYFKQHSKVYHPRPYDAGYAVLPENGEEISYNLSFGNQTAFYIPPRNGGRSPARLWIAFCGNGSLALAWTTILPGYSNSNDAFLLVDYPGYGKCQGYATIASTRATSEAALKTLAKQLFPKKKWNRASAPSVIPWAQLSQSISQRAIASRELSRSRRSQLCARRPALSLAPVTFAD